MVRTTINFMKIIVLEVDIIQTGIVQNKNGIYLQFLKLHVQCKFLRLVKVHSWAPPLQPEVFLLLALLQWQWRTKIFSK